MYQGSWKRGGHYILHTAPVQTLYLAYLKVQQIVLGGDLVVWAPRWVGMWIRNLNRRVTQVTQRRDRAAVSR